MNAGGDVPRVITGKGATWLPDCDCACGVELVHSSVFSLESFSGPWQSRPSAWETPLGGHWYVSYTPQAEVPIITLNERARRLREQFRRPRKVEEVLALAPSASKAVRQAVAAMVEAGVLVPWGESLPALWREAQPSTLTIWLYLTQQCNLRCPYCYVPHHGTRMSEEMALLAVERMLRVAYQHRYRRLRIKYAGGEPTLNFKVLQSAHRYALQVGRSLGIEVEGVVLTNGTCWSASMLDFVAKHGIRLGLSLDGGEQAHNRLRLFPDGRGSFEIVVATIEAALQRGIALSLSVTVTAWNLDGVGEAVQFAMERNLPFNLNFVRERREVPWLPKAELLVQAMRSAFDVMERYLADYDHPLTNVLDRARFDAPHLHPCSAGRDYLAIRPDGGVAACQMEVEHPLSSLKAGDPLAELRAKGRAVFAPTVDEYSDCAQCPWRYVCGGGCPLLRGTSLHTRYCTVYRTLYPDLVRLEGMRLLAHHVDGVG